MRQNNKTYTKKGDIMVFEPDERLKQKMAKDGSVLQYMYSVAGAGKGLAAMGACWLGLAFCWLPLCIMSQGRKGP